MEKEEDCVPERISNEICLNNGEAACNCDARLPFSHKYLAFIKKIMVIPSIVTPRFLQRSGSGEDCRLVDIEVHGRAGSMREMLPSLQSVKDR
ncbi:hypothetical protein KFK09_007814 [Dendrobium nobile]|uniref:Uncharacterized protein n=1 Tax=Dendrobium nobile TaxID=94219 RepID=A0A8T3BST1_DENNO|nr:hypothetical protein KFK09_007814 [Dendrobium nobile]